MYLNARLLATCRATLEHIVRDPRVKVGDIRIQRRDVTTFESGSPVTCYIVQIFTNDRSYIRGDLNDFKGSYKERIEAVLDFVVKQQEPSARAHVEILGPRSTTLERTIQLKRLLAAKQLADDSPIVQTARQYSIRYALIRGRHLLGPSPGLAHVVSELLTRQGQATRVLDLFSGTGIVSKVACRLSSIRRVVCVDHNPAVLAQIRTHLRDPRVTFLSRDVCTTPLPRGSYDLVVADPYYEDALIFLDRQLPAIRQTTPFFLLVSGGVEDLSWNEAVLTQLRRSGFTARPHTAFGQVIIEAQPRNPITRRMLRLPRR